MNEFQGDFPLGLRVIRQIDDELYDFVENCLQSRVQKTLYQANM